LSEKRIKGHVKQLKFILERLHEGINPADYRRGRGEEEIIPHSTLSDYLNLLKETGTAYEDEKEGKWYYAWKKKEEALRKEYQEYKTEAEYQAKLKHSKDLLEKVIVKPTGSHPSPELNENSPYLSYFLQHLESGYPELHKYYIERKELESKERQAKEEYDSEIAKLILGFEISLWDDLEKDRREVTPNILRCIDSVSSAVAHGLSEEQIRKRVKLELSDSGIINPRFEPFELIAVNKNLKDELEELIESCGRAESVQIRLSKFSELSQERSKAHDNFVAGIERILKELEIGRPLDKVCAACKVTIGR
jgi:hypothetical protein